MWSCRPTTPALCAVLNYNLDQTTVLAPADGFVAELQLLTGSMAQAQVPLIAFADTSSSYAIAVLGQNAIRYIRAGNPAEVALILQPVRIFNASVEEVAANRDRSDQRTTREQFADGYHGGAIEFRYWVSPGTVAFWHQWPRRYSIRIKAKR